MLRKEKTSAADKLRNSGEEWKKERIVGQK
jgi:hypothetical protein